MERDPKPSIGPRPSNRSSNAADASCNESQTQDPESRGRVTFSDPACRWTARSAHKIPLHVRVYRAVGTASCLLASRHPLSYVEPAAASREPLSGQPRRSVLPSMTTEMDDLHDAGGPVPGELPYTWELPANPHGDSRQHANACVGRQDGPASCVPAQCVRPRRGQDCSVVSWRIACSGAFSSPEVADQYIDAGSAMALCPCWDKPMLTSQSAQVCGLHNCEDRSLCVVHFKVRLGGHLVLRTRAKMKGE